jgi:formylglycine-generating enzyme required for sulfatase activity
VARPDTTRRVLRGGSWNSHRDNARCACRNAIDPGHRNNHLGLRLVRVSHILHAF